MGSQPPYGTSISVIVDSGAYGYMHEPPGPSLCCSVTPVPDVGDQAVFGFGGVSGPDMVVGKGTKYFGVTVYFCCPPTLSVGVAPPVYTDPTAREEAAEKQLALLILSRGHP